MAQFFDDFSAVTIGDMPIGASLTRSSIAGDYSVRSVGGTNQLRYFAGSGGAVARGMRYSLDSSGVTEVYSIINEPVNSDPQSARLIAFASDSPDNEYGAILDFGVNTLGLYRRVSGTLTFLSTTALGEVLNTSYYAVRLRVSPGSPNVIEGRVWGELGEEPATWNSSVTDSVLTLTGGWIGHVGFATSRNIYFKEISIGTDGDPAPTEPVAASRRRSPLLLTPW